MNDERRGDGEGWNKDQEAKDIPVMIGGRLGKIVGDAMGSVVGSLDGPRLGEIVGDTVGAVVGAVVGAGVGSLDGPTVGTGEGTGVGKEVVKHCVAPMNIFCVAVNRVLTSAAESSLLYMRKSLMPPLKLYISQLFFPMKLLDLDTDRGYAAGLTKFTWAPFM